MSVRRHELFEPRYRNERKRILFERWVKLGTVTVFFDATRDDVAIPPKLKDDSDFWIAVTQAEVYTSHLEGKTVHPSPKIGEFQFSIPWDAVHAFYSGAIHERHIYNGDIDRNTRRFEARRAAKFGKALPS